MATATARKSKVYTISLPPELAQRAEALAQRDSRTMSELFREAFRTYAHNRRGARWTSWANMRQAVTPGATPRPTYPGSLKRCVLKSHAAAGCGQRGDRRHRHECLDFGAPVCETSRHADARARKSDERRRDCHLR